jgi:NAD(P)-dependent dehydrogenase (short-subunit alcohol dehydrogenase family)
MLLKGKVAIVTGASSGIGKSIAQSFAREGAAVVVSDLNQDAGEKVVADIRAAGGEATFVAGNVSKPADCERTVQAALERYDRLDVACNNAGIGGDTKPTAELSIEGWQKVIDINLSGVFFGMKYQIPAMLKGGGGSIVNMASILGQVGFANSSAYVAAKHGVVGLSQTTAIEYAAKKVRVNSVGPGFIHTPLTKNLEEDRKTNEMLISLHPMGRLGNPEEVAELVLWLASEKSSFVTGAYYPVDGGYLAR